jgi:hypothetical protein
MNLAETELVQELTDAQAELLFGALISTPDTNTEAVPYLPPKIAAMIKPFYPVLPTPKLARLKLASRPAKNPQTDISVPVED